MRIQHGINMKNISHLIFEDYKIRRGYDESTETWFFSVVEYYTSFDAATWLSESEKLLESLEKSLKEGRIWVGYKL